VGCSSCEAWLDRYVDGDLEPRQAAWVARHLDQCPSCEVLHRRLRVVDGLLETMQPAELRTDFSSAVMAAVRELPIPAAPHRAWPFLAIGYLIVGWLALAAVFFELRTRQLVAAGVGKAFANIFAALESAQHMLSPVTPYAISAVVAVLTIDVLLFALLAVFYHRVGPRLAVHLAAVKAS
jgi:anti-sigma factor RsiW